MAGRLLLFLFFAVTLGQRLKPRLQRDRRNIRPNIILIMTDDQDQELGGYELVVTISTDEQLLYHIVTETLDIINVITINNASMLLLLTSEFK